MPTHRPVTPRIAWLQAGFHTGFSMASFLSRFLKFGSQNLAIDLGTANTLVYV
ncbi:MAG: hypothetical protein RLZZ427_1706, partial [Pseudomonadota bacterium]